MGCTEMHQIKIQQHVLLNKVCSHMLNLLVPAQVYIERTTGPTVTTIYAINSLDVTSSVMLRSVKDSVEHILC